MSALLKDLAVSLGASAMLDHDLSYKGYSVVDNALPLDTLRALAEEVTLLDSILQASPAKLTIKDNEYIMLTKPQVFELTIAQRSRLLIENINLLSLIPTIKSLWDNNCALADVFRSCAPALQGIQSLDQIKVAVIKPGGCFPCHTDVQAGTGRMLSVTLYLDEEEEVGDVPDETLSPNNALAAHQHITDHGELRIYPYPSNLNEPVAPVDILPTFGRIVLFSASNTFHRVLQSKRENRMCLSIMFYGDETTAECQHAGADVSLFQLRSSITPLIYFDEFCKSLKQAFSDTELGTGEPLSTASTTASGYLEQQKKRTEELVIRNYHVAQAVENFSARCRHAMAMQSHSGDHASLRSMMDLYVKSCPTFTISKSLL